MAKKESLSHFIKNIRKYGSLVERKVTGAWNKNTVLTKAQMQIYSPVKTGHLQGSATVLRAKITAQGLRSAVAFLVPYASELERGIRETGKRININTSINPEAQSGYAARGLKETEHFYIDDLKKVVSQVWNNI